MAKTNRALLIIMILGIAIGIPNWTSLYWDHLLVLTLIYAILTISFNLYVGFLGELTMAHTAFFGLGGYATGLITVKAGWPTGVGFLVDIGICAVGAIVIGVPALRLKGLYFVMMTVAFLGIIGQLAVTLYYLTGSTSGLRGIPTPSFGFVDINTTQSFYYLALITLVLIFIMVYWLINSRVGRGFVMVRDNPDLANALGVNPFKYKMIGFVASSVIAGVGGWLYAHYVNIMDPNVFGMSILFDVIFMAILGGVGTLVGPVVGAFVVYLGPELFTEYVYKVDDAWRTAFLAMFMLVIILVLPMGIWGTIKMHWMKRVNKPGGPASEQIPPPSNNRLDFLRAVFTKRYRPTD
ncbi:MAG: branched-chain amino acid ABC transporter permease [Dehalococcoidia bacterium]|nr:branched-chain amino acid ABC transporter permease [Dehalococcoidia bacterium]